jgi:hypothetical protein
MRASEADLEQTKDLELRDMVATMYAGLITADPTPLNPNPKPGLIERVEKIETNVSELQHAMTHRVFEGEAAEGGRVHGTIESAPE